MARGRMTEVWGLCEIYLPHVLAFYERYLELTRDTPLKVLYKLVELFYSCAWYLFEREHFVFCIALAETAETAYQSTDLQDEGLLLADIYTVQCAIHNETSKAVIATSYAKKAHEIRERAVIAKVLEEDHPNRANSFMNLGVCIANDDIQEALRLHNIAIKIREGSSRFTESQVQGLSLNYLNIGRCRWMVGELEKAAKSFEKSFSIIKVREAITGLRFAQSAWAMWALQDILGPTHHKTAASYYKVAWFLHKRKDYNRSIELLQLTLKVHEEKERVDIRPELARTKYKLSQVLYDAGFQEESQAMKMSAQNLRKELVGKEPDKENVEGSYDTLVAYFYR
ncbi:hypothetical protein GP486_004469 [Trichoglossum hirsutum]|uniref:Uncharacterized protein n=1 Tax=Trichoglossum hirsutum TaxID=265104 RepID=A0A9P8LAS8_9PEZI|nr:hypothetical protein GP486_004469 [Trichoglossum hirsutum]